MENEKRWEKMPSGLKKLNIEIHEKLSGLFKEKKGQRFRTSKVKELFEEKYGHSLLCFKDINWVQPSDHSENMINKGACWCAGTKDSIIDI